MQRAKDGRGRDLYKRERMERELASRVIEY